MEKSTIAYWHVNARKIWYMAVDQQLVEQFYGKIKLDKSYFRGTRKGKRGQSSAGKVAVFGLLYSIQLGCKPPRYVSALKIC